MLKSLKGPLKALNRKHCSHVSSRAAAANDELGLALDSLRDNPTDDGAKTRLQRAKKGGGKMGQG